MSVLYVTSLRYTEFPRGTIHPTVYVMQCDHILMNEMERRIKTINKENKLV